jgi:hypothetical protein
MTKKVESPQTCKKCLAKRHMYRPNLSVSWSLFYGICNPESDGNKKSHMYMPKCMSKSHAQNCMANKATRKTAWQKTMHAKNAWKGVLTSQSVLADSRPERRLGTGLPRPTSKSGTMRTWTRRSSG